ncbi:4Fe-4S dicluster domain-containing protein [Mesorhizobium sp. B2-7-3]|uniref:TAT-variant-translocated molybdopterin oxidoreductase n=1 Tax=Mesorhizobium sp. B2-7-3 TaxID=2589907 RepID=UPI00112E58B4|nr:TAT-variant-translocated molybdopterin oxidoreductase [Mesorhizobium sp. B2-7-3]TPJ14352.1 4Fe-4S dicluster domain-containing protein [Mesorhizobium sp. B2-7-3]
MSATADESRLWRSLAELSDAPEFRKYVEAEFPSLRDEGWATFRPGLDRRKLLKLLGAAVSFGGLAACAPADDIVPYVRQPENVVPGRAEYYATTFSKEGYGVGVLVETHEGRPTKIEGNPDHPASLGATDAIMQAAVLSLYDPDRSRTPLLDGAPADYGSFLGAMAALRKQFAEVRGEGLAILSGPSTSPTLAAQFRDLRAVFPEMRFYRHDALGGNAMTKATTAAFGRPLSPIYNLQHASVIVSLDDDFLGDGPGNLAYARGFGLGRRTPKPGSSMNRLYAIETTPTITGASADHRLAVRPSELDGLGRRLAALISGDSAAGEDAPQWLRAAADDLRSAGSGALLAVGKGVSADVAHQALLANQSLGAVGATLRVIEPPEILGDAAALPDFVDDAYAGRIDTAVVLDCNPVHTAPGDLEIGKSFGKITKVVHHGLYVDETARLARWHVPAAHDLESWSDLRAFDGTTSIMQPTIAPIFAGRTVHEILAVLLQQQDLSALDLVRRTWRSSSMEDDAWDQTLKAGCVAGSGEPDAATQPPTTSTASPPQQVNRPGTLEIRFASDPWLRDGRFANNAWLQELPRPLTKLVWSNAALMAPSDAELHKLANGDVIRISADKSSIDAPVWLTPGHPKGSLTLTFGFGRRSAGPVADLASGYDAFVLRKAGSPWALSGATVERLDLGKQLTTTQEHQAMEGRPIARHATWSQYRDNPDFVNAGAPPEPKESLYPEYHYDQEAWAMAIDENACIGCMACVAACQSENNIPTVGPEECARGHEMHWLRVDRYYEGLPDDPQTLFQPVPCMQCEKAPCEVVCPVNATVHTHDGINAQVYNRCIGTRYCSQNCPYKVRRFNFLEYQEFDKEKVGFLQAVNNPNVSVRSRGVMEKCTYCVQRIAAARIHAQIDNRPIADGEVVTACQQVCPTQAIWFGDLNDRHAAVNQVKASPLNYALLAELNTRPRTTYLGKVRNPNPALAREREEKGDGHGTG